jgi:hypothetical protein
MSYSTVRTDTLNTDRWGSAASDSAAAAALSAIQRSMAGNCAPPITVKGAVIVLFQALEEIPPHGNTSWLGNTYFEKPERRPIVQYGSENQVACGEHATGK